MSFAKRKRDNPSSSRELGNLGELNNDIPFDVLSRLPTKYMPRLKCVCKGWNRLISDPIFMKVQSQKREPVSGFIFQQRYRWCGEDIPTVTYIPVGKQDAEAELFQTVFDFLPEHVVVLSSCNGLVFCRSCFPKVDPCFYICNPLNHEWIRLEWDEETNREDTFALAFDPCKDILGTSAKFKLVKVKQVETEADVSCFSIDMYTSDTGAWKKSVGICKCNSNLYENRGVFVEGVLHWLTDGDEILTFHVEIDLTWLVSVPLPADEFSSIPEACIGDSDGKLHYIIVSQYGLQVWCIEDYFESRWSLKISKTLEELEEQHTQLLYNFRQRVTQRLSVEMEPWVDLLAFKDGYLLMRVSLKIMLYNIDTNTMQLLCSDSKLDEVWTVETSSCSMKCLNDYDFWLYATWAFQPSSLFLFFLHDKNGISRPNEFSSVSVLQACRGMLSDEAWGYFSSMTTDHGIYPGEDHYVHMVHVLGRAGHIKEVEELILSMPFQPGASAWQTLLNACQVH
ncbi:hypothetical protein V6N13_000779 [Hibiscus sabdariffa]|uniref:F-box domain-containing protein n=1 Tax=Hibiscus sabdariffa TaxID=183260 RepID=A0ABR2G6B7_9ROSI